MTFDVLIVGGSTAGLSAAIEARLAGLSALVFDPRGFDIDKPCGEGLMPSARRRLSAMGVDLTEGFPLQGVIYKQKFHTATGHFKPDQGPGLGIRRLALRAALRQRADELGVVWRQEAVHEIKQSADGVSANGVDGLWLIAADGLRSKIRRQLALGAPSRFAPRYGLRAHFAVKPWSNFVEVYWGSRCEAYVTPVAPDMVNIALLGPAGLRREAMQAEFKDLFAMVGTPIDDFMGAGPFEQRLLRRREGRVLLVGDAAGFLDAITGEGNNLAMASASAAIACIKNNRPEDYDHQWHKLTKRYYQVTSLLLSLAQSRARGLITPVIKMQPRLFELAIRAVS